MSRLPPRAPLKPFIVNEKSWLASLKPGDPVAIGSHFQRVYLARVGRLTATQIVVGRPGMFDEGETRFRKTNGRRIGDRSYDSPSLYDPSSDYVVRELALGRCVALRIKLKTASDACKDEATLRAALAVLTPPVATTTETTNHAGSTVVTCKPEES